MEASGGDVLLVIPMLSLRSPLHHASLIAVGWSLISVPPALAQASMPIQESAVLVGNAVGPRAMEAIVSATGHWGSPQPKGWDFTIIDPAARGGARTLKTTGRRLSAVSPEPGGYESGVPLGFFRWSDVKVDSIRAFQAADLEARGAMIGFDSVHYLLRAREGTTQPIWFLSLLDNDRRTVGRLEISATTGSVERSVWLRYQRGQSVPVKVEDSLSPYASMRPSPPPPPPSPTVPEPVQPSLPSVDPVAPLQPLVPGPPAIPLPPPGPAPVVPPLPDAPVPIPESSPGYTPLPN